MVGLEKQASGEYSVKKSMLEKLTEHYLWAIRIGNGGHLVGYYREAKEKVMCQYRYPTGIFTLRRKEGEFFLWDYDITPKDQRYI
ncbi:MAG: hypothetical protein AABY40_04390 [Nanoarchaeota archaeon]